jgi:hypothetical protein
MTSANRRFNNASNKELNRRAQNFIRSPSEQTWEIFSNYIKVKKKRPATVNNIRKYVNSRSVNEVKQRARNAASDFKKNPHQNTWNRLKFAHYPLGKSTVNNSNLQKYFNANSWRKVSNWANFFRAVNNERYGNLEYLYSIAANNTLTRQKLRNLGIKYMFY